MSAPPKVTARHVAALDRLTEAQRDALAGAHRVSDYSTVRRVFFKTSVADRQAMIDAGFLTGWQLTALGHEARVHLLAELRAIIEPKGE